jgi:hypothetical protein
MDYDNPLDYLDDHDIIRKYRLSRPLILDLCRMFEIDLQRPTRRSRAFPVSIQIMVELRFFQAVNGDIHNISQSSVSKITKDVTQCLVSVCRQYVVMPTDPTELQGIMQGFYNIANFPNVIGAINMSE